MTSATRRRGQTIAGLPGISGWLGLPERDRRLIEWLWTGDVVTAELAALLAYGNLGPRTPHEAQELLDEVALGLARARSATPRMAVVRGRPSYRSDVATPRGTAMGHPEAHSRGTRLCRLERRSL